MALLNQRTTKGGDGVNALESPIEICIFVVLFSPAHVVQTSVLATVVVVQRWLPRTTTAATRGHDHDPQTGKDSTTHLAQLTIKVAVVRFEFVIVGSFLGRPLSKPRRRAIWAGFLVYFV